MKRAGVLSVAVLCVLGVLSTAGVGHASILGQVWTGQPANDSSGLISSIPASPAVAEFYTNDINYDSSVGGYTIGGFLNNPTFFNTALSFDPTASLNNTLFEFTGQMYLNAGANNFVTPHDDGFELSIPGAGFDLQEGGPFSPTSTPYTVTAPSAGYYNFELAYFEGWGPPATIEVQVNSAPISSTPIPGALLLFGPGLVGLAAMRRRFKK